jgi:hypothetical protein
MAPHDEARSGRQGARLRGAIATFIVALSLVGLGGCTPPEPPSPEQPALRLLTVHGAFQLRAGPRSVLESRVGDVLVDYVLGAFLGTYPRHDFVRGLGSFTKRLDQSATKDIDLLTAAKYAQATAVTATELTARLSFIVRKEVAIGATAHVLFRFAAELPGGRTVPFTLRGRILLVHEGTNWFVFGYDLDRDDDESGITAEVSP